MRFFLATTLLASANGMASRPRPKCDLSFAGLDLKFEIDANTGCCAGIKSVRDGVADPADYMNRETCSDNKCNDSVIKFISTLESSGMVESGSTDSWYAGCEGLLSDTGGDDTGGYGREEEPEPWDLAIWCGELAAEPGAAVLFECQKWLLGEASALTEASCTAAQTGDVEPVTAEAMTLCDTGGNLGGGGGDGCVDIDSTYWPAEAQALSTMGECAQLIPTAATMGINCDTDLATSVAAALAPSITGKPRDLCCHSCSGTEEPEPWDLATWCGELAADPVAAINSECGKWLLGEASALDMYNCVAAQSGMVEAVTAEAMELCGGSSPAETPAPAPTFDLATWCGGLASDPVAAINSECGKWLLGEASALDMNNCVAAQSGDVTAVTAEAMTLCGGGGSSPAETPAPAPYNPCDDDPDSCTDCTIMGNAVGFIDAACCADITSGAPSVIISPDKNAAAANLASETLCEPTCGGITTAVIQGAAALGILSEDPSPAFIGACEAYASP